MKTHLTFRSIAFLGIVVMLFAILAGCSAPAAPAPAEEAPANPPAEAAKPAQEAVKVAMFMDVTCDDTGWGAPACEGLKLAEQEFGVEGDIAERVQMVDAEAAMRDYAERGYEMIIGHGFQFSDAAAAVAAEYPDTWFVVYNGYVEDENLISIDSMSHQLGYLAGIVAGKMTKSGTIAAVGGQDIPTVVRDMEGYCDGARSVNPEVDCRTAYIDTWDDVQKGSEAGKAMIDLGADVLFHEAGFAGRGVIQSAADNGLFAIGFASDESSVAPGTVLTSAIDRMDKTMAFAIGNLVNGSLKGGYLRPGAADGIFEMAPYADSVPSEVQDLVSQALSDIASGALVVEEKLEPSS